jgi:hypothetical protein
VPLHNAIARCAPERSTPCSRPRSQQSLPVYELVVAGLDPFGTEVQDLPLTCAALQPLFSGAGERVHARARARRGAEGVRLREVGARYIPR